MLSISEAVFEVTLVDFVIHGSNALQYITSAKFWVGPWLSIFSNEILKSPRQAINFLSIFTFDNNSDK